MTDFNIRSDSVNVEQIMRQIRARIREKRGVDYTEQQIRELAAVKLERFLDPAKVRSELMQQFREGGIKPLPDYEFEDTSLFESHRPALGAIRRLLRPLLMLFMNVNRLIHVLHTQVQINRAHAEFTNLSYEIQHNLVVEVTRLGIENKNLKMRVESLSSRLDFGERRARALESVVQYRPGEVPEEAPPADGQARGEARVEGGEQAVSSEQRRRRRRRRGRRGGTGRPGVGDDAAVDAAGLPELGEAADQGDAGDEGQPGLDGEGGGRQGDAPPPEAEGRPAHDDNGTVARTANREDIQPEAARGDNGHHENQ